MFWAIASLALIDFTFEHFKDKTWIIRIEKITFARMNVPVHAINYFYLLHVNGNAKKIVFVVKRYAVRSAKRKNF